eukprot:TRINITY_DN15638_c0_g1_i1.p1 TRINITY_DN15638_c0_g1~~TRINITY_DN15638_c0_g1_i1.p1  ORF type:complete len:528 (+),score=58.38 TRINITY_DN15638_c0_g1_i1:25-1584(+)
MFKITLLWQLLVFLSFIATTSGKVVSVSNVQGKWTFIDKFCFDTIESGNLTKGILERPWITVEVPKLADIPAAKNYTMVLYSDQGFSWPPARAIVDDDYLWSHDPYGTCIELTEKCPFGNCTTRAAGMVKSTYRLSFSPDVRRFTVPISQTSRPRFWYIAIANCKGETPPISINFHFENTGGWFRREFGVDHQGILELNLILVPIFAILMGNFLGRTHQEYRRQGDGAVVHAVVIWFIIIIFLELVESIQKLLAHINMARRGTGQANGYGTGAIASVLTLMLVCNFSTGFRAVGVTFSTNLADRTHWNTIFYGGVIVLLFTFLMYLVELYYDDPMSTLNIYQKWPAVILSCLRLPIACYYCHNIYTQVKILPDQKQYYMKWGAVFLAYILAPPFFILAAHVYSPHIKYRSVDCTVEVVSFVCLIALSFLLWPGTSLTMVLRNTYCLASSGPTHVPMSDSPMQLQQVQTTTAVDVTAGMDQPADITEMVDMQMDTAGDDDNQVGLLSTVRDEELYPEVAS